MLIRSVYERNPCVDVSTEVRVCKNPKHTGNDHRRVVCQHEREGGTRGDLYHCRFLGASQDWKNLMLLMLRIFVASFSTTAVVTSSLLNFPSRWFFSTTPAPIHAQNYRPRFYNGTLDTYGQALAEVLVHSVGWWVGQQKTVEVEIEDWSQLPPSFLGVGCEMVWVFLALYSGRVFLFEGGEFEIPGPVFVSLPEGAGGASIHILKIS